MVDSAKQAKTILGNELKALSKENWVNIELEDDNLLEWNIALIVLNPSSLYYEGYFKAKLKFPENYPYMPPEFRFTRSLFHPNVYPDGRVCISILHPPGEDEQSGELAEERWSPIQRAESVLLSILSLLDDAEINSPANVTASVMFRDQRTQYDARVRQEVNQTKRDIPDGFVMPTHESTKPKPVEREDQAFWYDSGDEDFGGSDSDEEMTFEEDEDEDREESEDQEDD